jgi:ribonucleoside-triphosphate reductase (formate)
MEKSMKDNYFENASERISYVGKIFKKGEKLVKEEVLNNMNPDWAKLHREGYIHIHDIDAYGLTYNCLTFNILNRFPYEGMKNFSQTRKIQAVFDYYREIIAKIGNEQSGGMSFANFDLDTATILKNLGIEEDHVNLEVIRNCISGLIYWCNNTHERMGQVSYYVTLNIGLADNDLARIICEMVIGEFENAPYYVYKPNIVFKVRSHTNQDLLERSLLCTAKKMIPTYLLCDSAPNKSFDPYELAIMGCRTRVVQNEHGKETSIGRGNIGYITVNLPRIAFDVDKEINSASTGGKLELFRKNWLQIAENVKDILLDRYRKLLKLDIEDFPTNAQYDLWIEDFSKADRVEEIFKNGTFSIGFIGLSEAIEILTGKKYYLGNNEYQIALDFVKFMRGYVNKLRAEYKMNFTLLATSGEFISGRFPQMDSTVYQHQLINKGFYTNSFHIEVDSGLPSFEKIEKEAPFHSLCNGGCITYVELKEAPVGNSE